MTHAWTFHESPWRHYQCDGSRETPNGLRIASVTQALGVLDKSGPLVGWAVNLTVEGIWRLKRETPRYRWPTHWRGLQADLKAAGLDHRSATSDAQDRGTTVHKAHEDWVRHGKVPNVAEQPPEWRGYMQAMARYLIDTERRGERAQEAEVIVGSATYGFAGTCDTVTLAVRADGKRERRDFKTSKQPYARTHFRQLAAYEIAAVECGEEPTQAQAVVCLYGTGDYEITYSTATPEEFLNVLQVWRDDLRFKPLDDEFYKARKAREAAARKAAA